MVTRNVQLMCYNYNDISESNCQCCLRVDDSDSTFCFFRLGLPFLGAFLCGWYEIGIFTEWNRFFYGDARVVGNKIVRLNRRHGLHADAYCHVGRFRRQAGLVYYNARG